MILKNLEDLKRDIKNNPEVKKYFANVKDEKEAAELARKLGYEVSESELQNDEELNEDMLEAVAGGKGDTKIRQDYNFIPEPGKYKIIDIDEETGNIKGYVLNK